MKIAILGDASRAEAWEKHFRTISAVKEVLIHSQIPETDEANACVLLNDSNESLQLLLQSIRNGFHTYLVSKLPTDSKKLKNIVHTAEEAGVIVMFSHWPSMSPSTRWIRKVLEKPTLIEIVKELPVSLTQTTPDFFETQWVDELAFVVKWSKAQIHKIDARIHKPGGLHTGLNISIRFDDGTLANIHFMANGSRNMHQRILSNNMLLVDCDATDQTIRILKRSDSGSLDISKKTFDPSKTTTLSAESFVNSIKMNQKSSFNEIDAFRTSKAIELVKQQLYQF